MLDNNPSCPSKSLIVTVSWKMRDVICVRKIFSDRADNFTQFHPISLHQKYSFLMAETLTHKRHFLNKLELMKFILI